MKFTIDGLSFPALAFNWCCAIRAHISEVLFIHSLLYLSPTPNMFGSIVATSSLFQFSYHIYLVDSEWQSHESKQYNSFGFLCVEILKKVCCWCFSCWCSVTCSGYQFMKILLLLQRGNCLLFKLLFQYFIRMAMTALRYQRWITDTCEFRRFKIPKYPLNRYLFIGFVFLMQTTNAFILRWWP